MKQVFQVIFYFTFFKLLGDNNIMSRSLALLQKIPICYEIIIRHQ